jgi:APA family basic amino acid/polyamine antiporter
MSFFKKKSFEEVKEVSTTSGLEKTLGPLDLILLGLGGIIGTGVFVLTGSVAAQYSGPAVMISYSIAGLTCIFVALVYSELATMIPTSGSVYTYSYVAFGECIAWIIGGIMILEMGFAAATVAAGWSGYIQALIKSAGFTLPYSFTNIPSQGGIMNLPALIIILFVSGILFLGTKDSKRLNAFLVVVKMLAVFAFIFYATPHFQISNWSNFMPYGFDDVVLGSSILFFAFTGFGTIATSAEECKNPKKDMFIGIVGSLVLATVVYIIIGGLVTGIAPFAELNNSQPLAHALSINDSHFGSAIVATGAVCGMTTVLMMNIYGISRIFYVMARDKLLPQAFARLHPRFASPYFSIIILCFMIGSLAAFAPHQILGQLSSMGALIDYIAVALAVMVFRIKLPDAHRPFKCPAVWVIAPIAFLSSLYLLSKQIISKDWSLMITGELIIYWIVATFFLYVISRFFVKNTES